MSTLRMAYMQIDGLKSHTMPFYIKIIRVLLSEAQHRRQHSAYLWVYRTLYR